MTPDFRDALAAEQPLLLFGAYDALSTRLIEHGGGKAAFVSGFSVVGARFGVPDIGLRAFGDIAAAVRDIREASRLPLLVDCDNGYGDVKNVVHTVQSYERIGVSAVMIEDQTWPKRCGHMAGKTVVPVREMVAKLRAATAERLNPATFVVARTDARGVEGLDAALRRAEAYLAAGADGLFVEAPESVEELSQIGREFDVPLLANPLEGGRSPILSPADYRDLGFSMIGYGVTLVLHAANAMRMAMEDIRTGGFAVRTSPLGFADFTTAVGHEEWRRIEDEYGSN